MDKRGEKDYIYIYPSAIIRSIFHSLSFTLKHCKTWLPFFFYERFLISQNLAGNSNDGRGVWSNKIRDTLELKMKSQFFFLYTVVEWYILHIFLAAGVTSFIILFFFFSFSLFLSFVLSVQYCINSYCCCGDLCPNHHRDKPSMLITLYTVYNSDLLYLFSSFFHVHIVYFLRSHLFSICVRSSIFLLTTPPPPGSNP